MFAFKKAEIKTTAKEKNVNALAQKTEMKATSEAEKLQKQLDTDLKLLRNPYPIYHAQN